MTGTLSRCRTLVLDLEVLKGPAGHRDQPPYCGGTYLPPVVGMQPSRGLPGRAPRAGREALASPLLFSASRSRRSRSPGSEPGPSKSPRSSALSDRGVPPTNNGAFAPDLDRLDDLDRPVAQVTGDAGGFPGVDHVDQVVRHTTARPSTVGLAVPMSIPR